MWEVGGEVFNGWEWLCVCVYGWWRAGRGAFMRVGCRLKEDIAIRIPKVLSGPWGMALGGRKTLVYR